MRAKDFIKEDYDTSQDADAGYDYEGGGNVDWDEHDDSPNDADGFIVDKPSGGYDASVDQKFIGNFGDVDEAYLAIRDEAGPNYFPSVWFVDDHGGMTLFQDDTKLTETIDFGYWTWSTEQFQELAKAAQAFMTDRGVDLETGEGYEEFFTPQVIDQAGEAALEILEDLVNGPYYDTADRVKANANYENTANGITDLIDFIGFEPREELNAGSMDQWNKEANELMASRGQLPKAQARIRRHKLR